MHIFYLYIEYSSEKLPVKWWTFVEATFDSINYLPYTSNDSNDLFYQSFLFRWCITPYVENTEIKYNDEICSINTLDLKTFEITMNDEYMYWSDWETINIEDVYFTYHDIIWNNLWELPWMDVYKNLKISYNSWDNNIIIEFPKASVDNKLFFTNYILPEHILNWKTSDEYIDMYRNNTNAVYNNCADLQLNSKDRNSVVFDLTKCEKSYIKYYQIKRFWNFDEFKRYINDAKENIIDLYIGEENIEWFNENKVILWQFISIFFNTESNLTNIDIRTPLTKLIEDKLYDKNYERFFIRDNFLLDNIWESKDIKEVLDSYSRNLTEAQEVEKDIKWIKSDIVLSWTWTEILERYAETIWNWITFNLQFSGYNKPISKISVQYENWWEYDLSSYSDIRKTAKYNLSNRFRNVKDWENNYYIRWYNWDNKIFEKQLLLYVKEKPTIKIEPKMSDFEIDVIYFNDKNSNYLVSRLIELFDEKWIIDYFNFKWFIDPNEFEWKIASKDYDIVIKWIDLGLRKDISWIFVSEDPTVNPSNYTNPELSKAFSDYLTTTSEVERAKYKETIDKIYSKNVPFFIVWKTYWKIHTRESLEHNYPLRLYDFIFRKEQLWDIKLIYKPNFEFEKLVSRNNFVSFLNEWLWENLSVNDLIFIK